jgi:transcriptional regulator with XRE-family HTH domain
MSHSRLPEIIGSALKAAREKRRLERSELATNCCLSSKMILELEEGGTSSFYSFQLKLASAKRVGTFLGLSPTDYLVGPPEVAEIPEQVESPLQVESQPTLEDAKQAQESFPAKKEEQVEEIVSPKSVVNEGEHLDDLIHQSTLSGTSLPHVSNSSNSVKNARLALGILFVLGTLWFVESKFQASSQVMVLVESIGAKKAPQQTPPASTPKVQEPQQPTAEEKTVAAVEPKPEPKPEPASVGVPPQARCYTVKEEQIPTYKSPNPSKLGDAVHIKTLVKQSICFVDGQGKQSVLDFEPNTAQTFKGVSPFIVSAQDLDNVEMYYQGWRVRPPSSGLKQLKLIEAAVQ